MEFNNSLQGSQSTMSTPYQEDIQRNNCEYDQKINKFTFQQIEIYLQNQYGVNVPAIVFEYSGNVGKDFIGWDYEDLLEFFSHFGEIEILEINAKVAYVLFKTFFDANTAREFLKNDSNFKDAEKNNFNVRWLNYEDVNFATEEFRGKIGKYPQKFFENGSNGGMGNYNGFNMGNINNMSNMNPNMSNMNTNMNNVNMMNNNGMMMNQMMMNNNMNNNMKMNSNQNINNNINPNMNQNNNTINYQSPNNNNNYYMMMNQPHTNNQNEINNSNNQRKSLTNTNTNSTPNQNQNSNNNNNNNFARKNSNNQNNNSNDDRDDKKPAQNGKYTCRFEIQIENDKDFQVARRLIGAKGCNMKKIVEMCSKKPDGSTVQDAVKLRLRGKGSGYKEGPFNKESDEPLHLCISSKFFDRYKIAIQLVNELVANVYEEYKKYCDKTNKTPVSYLAIKKEEGISSRKSTITKSEFDF